MERNLFPCCRIELYMTFMLDSIIKHLCSLISKKVCKIMCVQLLPEIQVLQPASLQTTPSLCQPRSSRHALLSSQQLRSVGFFCGRPCDMELVTRQYERPGHQQRLLQTFTEDVFIFSLLVYIAH